MSWQGEREGSRLELFVRHAVTSVLYFRGYRRLYPSHPFYTPGANRFLSKRINSNSKLFEWGSGTSTIWYSKRVSECIAVEHDKNWYTTVSEQLVKRGITNSKILFLPENPGGSKYKWDTDWKYYPILGRGPLNPELKDYIFAIDDYPDRYFGIIVIDGRERLPCLLHAINKLNEDGLLVFDDSARPRYKECFKILKGWHFRKFDFGLKQTTIFARDRINL